MVHSQPGQLQQLIETQLLAIPFRLAHVSVVFKLAKRKRAKQLLRHREGCELPLKEAT